MPSYNLTEVISHYQRKIERHPSEAEVLRHSLAKLAKLDGVSISVLQETGIGRVVNALKKSVDDDVARIAKDLVARWKEIVANEEEEEGETKPQSEGEELEEESEIEEQDEPPRKKEKRSHKDHHPRKKSKSSKHHHKQESLEEEHDGRDVLLEEREHRKSDKTRRKNKLVKEEGRSKPSDHHVEKHRSNEKKERKNSSSISSSKKSSMSTASSSSSNKTSAFDLALNSDTDLRKGKNSSKPSSSGSSQLNGQYLESQGVSSSLAVPEGISPHYKPLPPRRDADLDGAVARRLVNQSQDEALSALIAKSKTVRRTAVYSGTKRSGYYGEVPSLFKLCVHVLQEHVESVEECGNLSYDVLEPILDRAAPQSLMRIEEFNPYLMEDTGALWERFCRKNFPKAEREEMESWREMFERCTVEREQKLDLLKVKVKDSYVREKTGTKKAKLAYVGLNAKPPRNVMRAQAKNGTGIAVGQPLGRVNRPGATISPGPAGQPMRKPKVAPMMAKTLKMARGIKSGFRR